MHDLREFGGEEVGISGVTYDGSKARTITHFPSSVLIVFDAGAAMISFLFQQLNMCIKCAIK